MKRRYIFLIISLVLVVIGTYFMNPTKENKFIETSHREIQIMHSGIDSIFLFVDETMVNLELERNETQFMLDSLDTELVQNKQSITSYRTSINQTDKLNVSLKNKNIQLDSTIIELNNIHVIESDRLITALAREVNMVIFYKHMIDSLIKQNIVLSNTVSDTIYKLDTIYYNNPK
jgi:hypothetical protein